MSETITVLAQGDYGDVPNSGFSGAGVADAGVSFLVPILIIAVIALVAVLVAGREMAKALGVFIVGAFVVGLLLSPSIFTTMGENLAALLPG